MKLKTLIAAGIIVMAGIAVSSSLIVNAWRQTPYGVLHPNAAILLHLIKIRGITLFSGNQSPAEIRQARADTYWVFQKKPDRVARVRDIVLPGPGGAVPVRIYSPRGKSTPPVIIYFHGGGWMMGSLDSHDNVCRLLANKTGWMVISVDYSLAPEHPFPAALHDAYAALLWVSRHGEHLHADPSKIILAGDSAGGNLAAAVAMMARDKQGPCIAAQVLLYPATNLASMTTASYAHFAENFLLTRSYMEHFRSMYLPDEKDRKNTYASPLLAKNVKGLPPAIVLTAEFDPLRDEGELYAEKLKTAGVPVSLIRFKGMIHGFISMDRLFAEASQAMDTIALRLESYIE